MRIKWNREAVSELLHSPGVVKKVDEVTEDFLKSVNARSRGGYESSSKHGSKRYRSQIYPANWRARNDNYRNNTLESELMERKLRGGG